MDQLILNENQELVEFIGTPREYREYLLKLSEEDIDILCGKIFQEYSEEEE